MKTQSYYFRCCQRLPGFLNYNTIQQLALLSNTMRLEIQSTIQCSDGLCSAIQFCLKSSQCNAKGNGGQQPTVRGSVKAEVTSKTCGGCGDYKAHRIRALALRVKSRLHRTPSRLLTRGWSMSQPLICRTVVGREGRIHSLLGDWPPRRRDAR